MPTSPNTREDCSMIMEVHKAAIKSGEHKEIEREGDDDDNYDDDDDDDDDDV